MFEVDVLLQIYCLFPPRAHDFNCNTFTCGRAVALRSSRNSSKAQIASEHFAYAYGLNAVLLSTGNE